jgi:hypothetical protein
MIKGTSIIGELITVIIYKVSKHRPPYEIMQVISISFFDIMLTKELLISKITKM